MSTNLIADLEAEVIKALDLLTEAKNAVDVQAQRVESAKEIAQDMQKAAFRAERIFKDELHILNEKSSLAASAEVAYMVTLRAHAVAVSQLGD